MKIQAIVLVVSFLAILGLSILASVSVSANQKKSQSFNQSIIKKQLQIKK